MILKQHNVDCVDCPTLNVTLAGIITFGESNVSISDLLESQVDFSHNLN
jgi:hypothetical protein